MPRFWVDKFKGLNYHLTWQERREYVIDRVEGAGFGWWIVMVAGMGFLTDSYDIFAINTVTPMLGIIYWQGEVPSTLQLGLNCATFIGAMFGQVLFGILADIYGRRRMYGLELVLTITASLGFAASSSGVNGSMSIAGWLIFWRFVNGIGIGAGYPLSAVITSEYVIFVSLFSIRGAVGFSAMLVASALAAITLAPNLHALRAVFAPTKYRSRMIAAVFFCQPLGQLLAASLAIVATEGFRNSMMNTTNLAACSAYSIDPQGITCARTIDRMWRLVSGLGAVPAIIAIIFRLTIPESVYWILDVRNDSNTAMHMRNYWPLPPSNDTESDHNDKIFTSAIELEDADTRISYGRGESHMQHDEIALEPIPRTSPTDPIPQTNQLDIIAITEDPNPVKQSLSDFYDFFIVKKNWTDLFATSMNWMLMDFTFLLLNTNSSRIVPSMFSTPSNQTPHDKLLTNEWHTVVATSVGAVCGGTIAIKILHHFSRRDIQFWFFLLLGVLFVVVGTMYVTLLQTSAAISIIILYVILQFVYNVGPNATKFIIPAEAFPTRYRCTCHGISAASGKLGSVLGQIVITGVLGNDSYKNVGYMLISFVVVMFLGAGITKSLTPETCDIYGKSRPLWDLSLGKAHRKKLEQEERRAEKFRARDR